MLPVELVIRRNDFFLRRRDLVALGYTDAALRSALARKRIFRVRHGWYSVPDAPEAGIRAVRVGGRLTGLSALESHGIRVPRPAALQVAVPPTASRLRNPDDRRARLPQFAAVTVFWSHRTSASPWRVSVADALVAVLSAEGRDAAVAACSAVLHVGALREWELDLVFARAAARARKWRTLVSSDDESHGETFARLWFGDARIPCEQQVEVPGVGRVDSDSGRTSISRSTAASTVRSTSGRRTTSATLPLRRSGAGRSASLTRSSSATGRLCSSR